MNPFRMPRVIVVYLSFVPAFTTSLARERPLYADEGGAKPRVDLYGDPLPERALSRIGTVRRRGLSTSVASLSPDRAMFAGSDREGAIHLVDAATEKDRHVVHVEQLQYPMLAWSPDGKTIAAWYAHDPAPGDKPGKRQIAVIDTEGATVLYTFALPEAEQFGPHLLDYSPDGQRLVACDAVDCRVLDVADSGRMVKRFKIGEATARARRMAHRAYCRATGTLAWTDADSAIYFRRVFSGGPVAKASRAAKEESDEWPAPEQKSLHPFKHRTISSLAFSTDGTTFAVAWGLGLDSWGRSDPEAAHPFVPGEFEVVVHDFPSGRVRQSLQGPRTRVTEMVLSRDGALVAGRETNHMRIWNVDEGKELDFSPLPPDWPEFFSEDGKRLHLAGREALDLRTGTMRFQAHRGEIGYSALSPDGMLLATSAHDHTIRTWETATGRPLAKLAVERRLYAGELAFVDRGRLLAAAHHDRVVLRDPATLKPASTLDMRPTDIEGVHLDDRGVAYGGPEISPLGGRSYCRPRGLAAQAFGKYLAIHYAGVNRRVPSGFLDTVEDVIAVYDVKGVEPMREIAPPKGKIENMHIAASIGTLAYCHKDLDRTFATVVDVATAKDVWRLDIPAGFEVSVYLTEDGKLLFVTLCENQTFVEHQRKPVPDRRLQIWDIAARTLLKEFVPNAAPAPESPFLRGGQLIVTYAVRRNPPQTSLNLSRGSTDKQPVTLPIRSMRGFAVSANEKRLVVAAGAGNSLLCYEIDELLHSTSDTPENEH